MRPTRAEIDLNALKHNFDLVRKLTAPSKIMAVVKAEAYGHGLIAISKEFVRLGADYLAVSFLEEGIELRKTGVEAPILVMGGLVDEQIRSYLDYDLEITVSSVWKARHVEEIAAQNRKKAKVHLKFDTGMGRIGQNWRTADVFLNEIASHKHVDIIGLYTHLASSDEEDLSFTRLQLNRFEEIIRLAKQLGLDVPLVHAANSGAIIQTPEQSRFDMVRPGIMLYGWAPSRYLQDKIDLKPAMTLRSEAVFVKKPLKGTPIGYGSTWVSPGGRWIATLPIGYGDGYPRLAGNRTWVMLRGRKCPLAGRVSMDQITVDAGDEAYLGDEAILFGGKDGNFLSLWDLAEQLETIPYEIMCGLTSRVPRIYLRGENAG